MAGTLLLFVVAGVDAAASLGLGWLFLRCYPEVTPWLNDVSDLQWPARTWGAMLGVAIFLVAGLLRLHQATPLHRSTLYWAAAVAGPRILISLGSRLLPGDDLSNAGMMDEASLLAFGALCALVGFSPQILAMVYGLIVCASAAVLFWSLGPFRSWWRYARSLTSWNNVPALQQIVLDSSLKNVKQNDFNNEVARSGCGEVKRDFKIDDILDGFLLAR